MDLRCQLALDKSRDKLVEDLDIKRATDYLVSNSVLTWEDNERILLPNQTSFDQRRSLLGVLPQKGQKAFDTFCEFLRDSQFWLHDIVVENCKDITEGISRHELQEALTHKLHQFVQNDPSKILKHAEDGIYIEQSIRLETETGSQKDEPSTSSILTSLSNATPGDRIIVYGGGGMGKSTFCRKVAKTWADGNSAVRKRFDYIFPIPLRTVQSCNLIDIICRDVGLIPESCKARLQQELDLIPTRILFILDSFEEQSDKAHDNVINKLFRRELFSESAVLVTSRPNARIQWLQNKTNPCTSVHLQGLTAIQTGEYLKRYPNLHEDDCSKIEQSFGASFLQCPLNLWLICNLLVDTAKAGEIEIPETQTVLLNCFMQHIMLAYVKKRKLAKFTPSAQSPMEIEDAPEARSILSTLGRLCYIAIEEKSHVLKTGQEVLSTKDVIDIGLFTEGPDENTVALPHPVFQEYLAAVHLSTDKLARKHVIRDIVSDLESSNEKRSLEDVLSSQGLKETIRFLITLLPAATKDFCDLFVIKQRNVKGVEGPGSAVQPDLQYEFGLLRECPDTDVKKDIAFALLNAPVIFDSQPRNNYVVNTGSYELLSYFTKKQCLLFLKKMYNVDSHTDKLALCVNAPVKEAVFDQFAVGFAHLYGYSVQIPSLNVVHSHLPVGLLRENMAAVRRLHLVTCVLYDQLAHYQSSYDIVVARRFEIQTDLEKAVTPLDLLSLDGVSLVDSTSLSRSTMKTAVTNRQTLDLAKMKNLFGEVKKVKLSYASLCYSPPTRWSSVTDLAIWRCSDVDIALLSEAFPNIRKVVFEMVVVQLRSSFTQWQEVKSLAMVHSFLDETDAGHLNKVKARDELKDICPQALLDLAKYKEQFEPHIEVVALLDFKGDLQKDFSFRQGDVFSIVQKTRDPMWWLARNQLGEEGRVPTSYVTAKQVANRLNQIPLRPMALMPVALEPMPWFHGRLTRNMEEMLSSSKEGTYLIRDSSSFPNQHVLCIRYRDDVWNYRIVAKGNKLTISNRRFFSCLPRLVEHYERDAGGLCTKLEQYVSVQGQSRVTADEAAFLEKGWLIEAENIELQDRISSWEYEEVLRGTYLGKGVMVRRPKQTRTREATLVEAAILTTLQHPNVATFQGVILEDTVQLVTECLNQGSMLRYIRKATEVTEEQQLKFARDICHGMIHLEKKGFVHGCLAASRVWVHADGTAKLFDLWQAKPVDSDHLVPPPARMVEWASPEVLQSGDCSFKSDMWSFGVVLWEIYTLGKKPYSSLELLSSIYAVPIVATVNKRQILQHLKQGHRLQIPADCPQCVSDIMKEAWATNPADRPTFSAVLERLVTDEAQGIATQSICTRL